MLNIEGMLWKMEIVYRYLISEEMNLCWYFPSKLKQKIRMDPDGSAERFLKVGQSINLV